MKEMTRRDYDARMAKAAEEAFEDHDTISVNHLGERALIKKRGSGLYAVEIVVLSWRRVVVHGDIAPVVFTGTPDRPKGPSARAAVYPCMVWVADGFPDYLRSKVEAGPREHVDDQVALCDLRQLRRELEKASVPAAYARRGFDPRLEAVDDAIESVERGHLWLARQTISNAIEDGWEVSVGEVVPPAVFYARAACRRARELWRSASQ